VEKYWTDPDFAERLHKNPKGAIEFAFEITLREEMVKLAFSSEREAVLVLPENPINGSNSWDEEFASRTIFNCPCASSGTMTGNPTVLEDSFDTSVPLGDLVKHLVAPKQKVKVQLTDTAFGNTEFTIDTSKAAVIC
jgi:hypothetical protein